MDIFRWYGKRVLHWKFRAGKVERWLGYFVSREWKSGHYFKKIYILRKQISASITAKSASKLIVHQLLLDDVCADKGIKLEYGFWKRQHLVLKYPTPNLQQGTACKFPKSSADPKRAKWWGFVGIPGELHIWHSWMEHRLLLIAGELCVLWLLQGKYLSLPLLPIFSVGSSISASTLLPFEFPGILFAF